MQPIRRILVHAALAVAALAAAPAAAQTLYGRVTDAGDSTGVAAAQVIALDSAGVPIAWALSGRDGRYELRLPEGGVYRLQVHRVGFAETTSPTVTVGRERREVGELGLRRDAVRLEGIEARSRVTPPFRDPRARGFFDRMARGRGLYYTAEQIAEMNRPRTTEVITWYAGITLRRGRLWMGGDRRGCSPTIYIDGFRKSPWTILDDAIAPEHIWGIEVYRYSFEIPNDLPRDDMAGNCGVVMIWTAHS